MKKRARDPGQLAKFVVDVATGEIEDTPGKGPRLAQKSHDPHAFPAESASPHNSLNDGPVPGWANAVGYTQSSYATQAGRAPACYRSLRTSFDFQMI